MMIYCLSMLLILSLLSNLYLLHRLRLKPKKELDLDARQLLHDLSAGAALIRVIPLDPQGLFYRSPRHS